MNDTLSLDNEDKLFHQYNIEGQPLNPISPVSKSGEATLFWYVSVFYWTGLCVLFTGVSKHPGRTPYRPFCQLGIHVEFVFALEAAELHVCIKVHLFMWCEDEQHGF